MGLYHKIVLCVCNPHFRILNQMMHFFLSLTHHRSCALLTTVTMVVPSVENMSHKPFRLTNPLSNYPAEHQSRWQDFCCTKSPQSDKYWYSVYHRQTGPYSHPKRRLCSASVALERSGESSSSSSEEWPWERSNTPTNKKVMIERWADQVEMEESQASIDNVTVSPTTVLCLYMYIWYVLAV